MNNDDFWTKLASGNTRTVLAGSMDAHLSDKSIDDIFSSRAAFVEGVLRSSFLPDEVLDGTKLFLSAEKGKYIVHTRFQKWFASKYLAKAERVFEEMMLGKLPRHHSKMGSEGRREILSGMSKDPYGLLSDLTLTIDRAMDPVRMIQKAIEVESGKQRRGGAATSPEEFQTLVRLSGRLDKVMGLLGDAKRAADRALDSSATADAIAKLASPIRVASLGDLTQFLKRADGKLIHKSTNDLWSYSKDADGNFLVERLFDDEGEPLKG